MKADVIIDGVPYKLVDGELVEMTPRESALDGEYPSPPLTTDTLQLTPEQLQDIVDRLRLCPPPYPTFVPYNAPVGGRHPLDLGQYLTPPTPPDWTITTGTGSVLPYTNTTTDPKSEQLLGVQREQTARSVGLFHPMLVHY